MSRSSPAHPHLVRFLAGMQVLLLACSAYVVVAGDVRVVKPRPAAPAHVASAFVSPADPTTVMVPDPREQDETASRSRTQRQQPVTQTRTNTPPNPKKAKLDWPVFGPVTSPFGPRGTPEDPETQEFHHGMDIGCGKGTPVRAARGGRVVAIGEAKAYGNGILVDHENGYMTLYAHLSDFTVQYQDRVARGRVIGACGDTGRATGPHLHFEVRYGGYVWDPATFLP